MGKSSRFVLWFLAAALVVGLGIFSGSEAVTFISTGNSGDTIAGSLITAEANNCTLDYTDAGADPKAQVKPGSDITLAVAAEYGISGIGTPADQSTPAVVGINYSYAVTNEGNASQTIYLSNTTSYTGGASGWGVLIRNAADDATISDLALAEDAEAGFKIKVTPAAAAYYGQTATVVASAETRDTPVGQYTGGNGLTYGGFAQRTDSTTTGISSPLLTLSRVSTVDAPAAFTGDTHSAVPGAVVTYTYTYNNTGNAASASNVIVDKVPTYTKLAHFNVTGAKVKNVTVTAAQGNATGWRVYTTTDAGASRAYGNYTNWTLTGTIDATSAWSTAESGAGALYQPVSTEAVLIKYEKASVSAAETNTLTWGVTIR